jgi:response regulator NasT
LVERAVPARPDLVITSVLLPDGDGIAAAEVLYQERPLPILLTTPAHNPDHLVRAAAGHALAYLIKPINRDDLEAAVTLVTHRFAEMQALREEASSLRQALEDRKRIERAKGIVMQRLRVDEPDAFRRMQRVASIHNRKLTEVAEALVRANEIFVPLEEPVAPIPAAHRWSMRGGMRDPGSRLTPVLRRPAPPRPTESVAASQETAPCPPVCAGDRADV